MAVPEGSNQCDDRPCSCADLLSHWPTSQPAGRHFCESSARERLWHLWSGGWQHVDSVYGKAMIRPCIDCNALTDAPERFNLNGVMATWAFDNGLAASPNAEEENCGFVIGTLLAGYTQQVASQGGDTSGITESYICRSWAVDQIASETPFEWKNPPYGTFASICPNHCYDLDPTEMQGAIPCVVYNNEPPPSGVSSSNGEEVCQNKGYDEQQCNAIGCCHFDGGCWSSVGQGDCYVVHSNSYDDEA